MLRHFLMLKDLASIFQEDAKKICIMKKSNEVNECQILSLNLEDDWKNSGFRAGCPATLKFAVLVFWGNSIHQKTATFGDSLIMTDSKKKTLRATCPFPFVMFLHPSNNVHGWDSGEKLILKEHSYFSNFLL